MITIQLRYRLSWREFWVGPELMKRITQASTQVTQSLMGYIHESSGSA